MSNQEHVDILKQGVEVWNQWRSDYPEIQPNLRSADLRSADLIQANLTSADLLGADLCNADLHDADLIQANLVQVNLASANLRNANLIGADLIDVDLIDTNFIDATVGWTVFGNVDLSTTKGLETIQHEGPSTIGVDTFYRSQGNIPEEFLRGAGVDDTFIAYIRSFVGKPIDYYSCFISYSSRDKAFAKRLYADLQSNNVRCWFAPHDLKTGDRYRDRIDESIRLYDKLLLILSKHAVTSSWVEQEVETALEKERDLREQGTQRTVLFPVKLDDTVMQTTTAWAANLRRIWHIGDFCQWKDDDQYQKALSRLLRDLKAEV